MLSRAAHLEMLSYCLLLLLTAIPVFVLLKSHVELLLTTSLAHVSLPLQDGERPFNAECVLWLHLDLNAQN